MKLLYGQLGLNHRELKAFTDDLRTLQVMLAGPEARVAIQLGPLPACDLEGLSAEAMELLGWPLNSLNTGLKKVLPGGNPVIIACPCNHPLARAVKHGDAQWGATTDDSMLALCWHLDRYVFWHEMLHLLGVPECYEPNTHSRTCSMTDCIMRWDPMEDTVRDWPFLCQDQLTRIREYVAAARRPLELRQGKA